MKIKGKNISEIEKFSSVLKEKETIYYVDEAKIIEFITINSGMDWNTCCDYVREENIVGEEGKAYWDLKSLNPNTEGRKWIKAFFDAHSWIKSMMVVFDD